MIFLTRWHHMKLSSVIVIIITLVLLSCFIEKNNVSTDLAAEEPLGKKEVKELYEKVEILRGRLSYSKSNGPPIKDLEGFLSMYSSDELDAVISLHVNFNEISKITGLERLPNLEHLVINGNCISNIDKIYIPPKLSSIELSRNPLSDISYLFSFPQLTNISIEKTNVISIAGIGSLSSLRDLNLLGSKIEDFSPLLDLTSLVNLFVRFNPGCLNENYIEIMEMIIKKNPNLNDFQYL